MDIWTATRTFLKRNPGVRRKELLPYVIRKTGKGKSAICDEWSSLDLQGKIYRDKGRYWLEKPSKEKLSKKSIELQKAIAKIKAAEITVLGKTERI